MKTSRWLFVVCVSLLLIGAGCTAPTPVPAAATAPATAPAISATAAAIASPTPPISTVAVTATASAPASRSMVAPTSAASPITLIEPQNGAGFSGSTAYILLKWNLNRSLTAGERYQVTLDCDRANAAAPEIGYATDPQWPAPAHIYNALTGARQCRWRVRTVDADGRPVSPDSALYSFVWKKGSGNATSPLATPMTSPLATPKK